MVRRSAAGLGLTVVLVLLLSQTAFGATEVGNRCAAKNPTNGSTVVSLANAAGNPLPATVPSAGVITSWTFDLGLTGPPGTLSEQLKVLRPAGPKQFTVIGESPMTPISSGINTFSTRISVLPGDAIGAYGMEGSTPQGAVCSTGIEGERVGTIEGDLINGSTAMLTKEIAGAQMPIVVKVEPDADGDGFGDETQDSCPQSASVHVGPCPIVPGPPAPPPPLTLSATATPQRGLVKVFVTDNAQASVTVAGTAKVGKGKGKSAHLSGGTQVVLPGTIAKFVVLLTERVKAKLAQLSPKQSLSLKLSATAPGATAPANLTVKVRGQARVGGR